MNIRVLPAQELKTLATVKTRNAKCGVNGLLKDGRKCVMGNKKIRKMDELDARIILELADNRMNESEVARVVFMHRNGVVHRIEKIHQITGLDPTDFWDLCKLVQMVRERGANDG